MSAYQVVALLTENGLTTAPDPGFLLEFLDVSLPSLIVFGYIAFVHAVNNGLVGGRWCHPAEVTQ